MYWFLQRSNLCHKLSAFFTPIIFVYIRKILKLRLQRFLRQKLSHCCYFFFKLSLPMSGKSMREIIALIYIWLLIKIELPIQACKMMYVVKGGTCEGIIFVLWPRSCAQLFNIERIDKNIKPMHLSYINSPTVCFSRCYMNRTNFLFLNTNVDRVYLFLSFRNNVLRRCLYPEHL